MVYGYSEHWKLYSAVCQAMLKSETKIIIAVPSIGKKSECLRELNNIVKENKIPAKQGNKIVFKNGSVIEVLNPAKESESIRGRSALKYLDWIENYISQEEIDEVLTPFLRGKRIENDPYDDAAIIYCSSK